MFSNEIVPVNTRWGIIIASLVLGMLWYCSNKSGVLYAGDTASIFIQALCISCAPVLALGSQRFSAKRLWGAIAGVAVMACVMAAWANWNVIGLENTYDAMLITGSCSGWLAILLYFLLPWVQHYLSSDKPGMSYQDINHNIWLNAITVLLTIVITLIGWLVLWLWAMLFQVIDISFFRRLFLENNFFRTIATSFMIAIAVLFCRSQSKIIEAVKKFFILLARGIFPLLALIALLFLAMLPFVGLDHVTKHISSAGTLNTLAALIMILTWIVGTSSRSTSPWNRPLTLLVRLSMLLLPVFTLIAAWSLGIRIYQYGWTPLRVQAALIILTLAVGAFSVALQTVRCRNAHSVNVDTPVRLFLIMAVAMIFLSHTSIIDPYRIGVNAHMARYHNGEIKADDVSISMLSDSGRRGIRALQTLKKDSAFMSSETRSARVGDALNSRVNISESITVINFQDVADVTKGSVIPESWWEWMVNERSYTLDACYHGAHRCLIKSLDLNGDKNNEIMLCDVAELSCDFYSLDDKEKWSYVGDSASLLKKLNSEKFRKALEGDQIELKPKAWKDLVIDGETVIVNYQDR